jgi:hypothetical protein
MLLCSDCGQYLDDNGVCNSCDRQTGSPATVAIPRVTWDEVDEHLTRRLFLDEEWLVRGEGYLHWYPWFLQQRIYLRAEGEIADWTPDNWMLITSEIDIASLDETRGITVADELNKDFSMGVFVWDGGILRVQSTLNLNPLGRQLLTLFHTQILAQAARAHEVAIMLDGELGVEVLKHAHPESGFRNEADELVQAHGGGTYGIPIAEELIGRIDKVRAELLKDLFQKKGYEIGLDNDEVTYFMTPHVAVGVGSVPESRDYQQYGPGLRTLANFNSLYFNGTLRPSTR